MNSLKQSLPGLLGLPLLFSLCPVDAATITVNTTADQWNNGGSCSLREAVGSINNGANGRGCTATGSYGTDDTVIVPAGTYALTRTGGSSDANGDIDIRVSMSVIGDGGGTTGTVVDASAVSDSAFEVIGGTVNLTQLRVTGGASTANFRGGGVQNQSGATLTLSHSTVIGNTGSGRAAGGVGNSGTLFVRYSTVTGNSNADTLVAAGIDNNDGTLTVTNSTVSGNNGDGPGVFMFSGTGQLVNVTLNGNATAGVTAQNGTSNTVSNTIVTDGCISLGGGTLTDGDYNIDSGSSCGFSAANSQNNTNPNLGPLADNGGGTFTHEIDDTSAAFDQIPTGSNQCLGQIVVDQRSAPRAGGTPDTGYAACDVGAFEYAPGYTLAVIADVRGYTNNAGQTLIEWTTVSEVGTTGFHLQRRDPANRMFVDVTAALIPGLIESPQGGTYAVVDEGALAGESHTYRLVETEISGRKRRYGPWRITIDGAAASAGAGQWFAGRYRRAAHQSRPKTKAAAIHSTNALPTAMGRSAAIKQTATIGKIVVRESGVYRLEVSTMAAMLGESERAVRSRLAGNRLQLTNRGQPVAWFKDDDHNALYFYGQALDSPYTRDNVYWLKRGRGTLMARVSGATANPVGEGEFSHTEHFEKDLISATSHADHPDSDYWYWDYLMAAHPEKGRGKYTLEVKGLADGAEASITVYLLGTVDLVDGDDHRVEIHLNGAYLDAGTWDGRDRLALNIPFSSSLLRQGTNELEVISTELPGVEGSVILIDAIDLTYPHRYRAAQGALEHYADGSPALTVSGFADPAIKVLDLDNPAAPRLYADATIDRTDGWRVSYRPTNPNAPHLAFSDAGVKSPRSATPATSAGLKDASSSAEYLAIAPRALRSGAKSLVRYREGTGMSTRLVFLEDIYDEFNYGLASPHAVRQFLSHAYRQWSVRPRYVALVGKGTIDYRDIQEYGDNFMPPMMVATQLGLFSADNAFADVNKDGIPEMAVGRIPARSNESLKEFVRKLAQHESSAIDADVLLLSDNSDQGGNFWRASREVAKLLPPRLRGKQISLAKLPVDAARKRLFQGLNKGVGIVNYLGHGATRQLAAEGLLSRADVPELVNESATPILTALTCIVNRFELPGYDSLGELLVLRESAGMVAVWSASGLSLNKESVVLNKALFKAMNQKANRRLGDTIRSALKRYRKTVAEPQITNTYNLLGDPATIMR